MKFDPVGKLLYATYLGGSATETPSSCIVNTQKQLVLLGFTSSDGRRSTIGRPGKVFPTTVGVYDQTFNGGSAIAPLGIYEGIYFDHGSDIFIATLSEHGDQLVHSTFLGGSNNDGLSQEFEPVSRNYGDQLRGEIYCDDLDNIYVVTKTYSSDIINKSVPGYDQVLDGPSDAYVCKLSADLSSMMWNTYVGGSSYDAGYSIRVTPEHTVYIAGGTTSTDLPGTSQGLKSTLTNGDTDGFITHISADGNTLLQATYIGTSAYDQCFFIQLDTSGNIYVLGQTEGNYPMSANVYGQPSRGQFIQKIDSTLSTSLLSTTFGNDANKISIVPTAFLVNNCDNILLSGWGGVINALSTNYLGGTTNNLETTSNAEYRTTDGSDFYLMVIEKDFKSLLFGTYFGGPGEPDHVDGGTSRFDKNGIIYQSVCASCGGTSNFPVSADPVSKTNNSFNCNNACFKYDLSNLRADFTLSKVMQCDTTSITLTNTSTGGSSFAWDLGDGTQTTDFGPIKHAYSKPGTYIIRLIATDLTTCIGRDTATKTLSIYPRPSISILTRDTTICLGDTTTSQITCNPYYQYAWSPATRVSDPSSCNPVFYPTRSQQYYVTGTDTSGCIAKDSFMVNVAHLQHGINWENMTHCDGKPTIRFSNPSIGKFHYLWTFGDGTSSTENNPVHEYSKGDSYAIVLDIYNDYCTATEKTFITLEDIKIPNLFTPNGDSFNECFEIKGLYDNWNVEVYNAWSKRVFKSDSYKNDFCGDNLSSSVYYYLVCPPYGSCCKSWVQIIKD